MRDPVTMMSPPASPGWPVGVATAGSPCCGSVASIEDGAASTADGAVPSTGAVGAGGLMITANLKPIAADLHVDKVPVTILGVTMAAITFAATIDRVLNGLTRPFFGWVSDRIGRENTMFIAFAMEGIGIYMLYLWGHDPLWFVLLSGFVFFAWGEIYSLFPSTCTDTFGSKFAATNAGLLYTAKGTAALLVPLANYLQQSTGSWDGVFLAAAGANILASVLAIAVLKPWRKHVVANAQASTEAPRQSGVAVA